LCGSGYLFNQRYPKFVKWVRANHALGNVDTSIEIVGLESNANKIVYLEDEPKEEFRTPCEFSFSGTAILSVTPSDSNAIVLEIAQKKEQEEKKIMFDEKTMRDVIVNAINETNSKNDELNATITELNSTIAERDNTIVELNATVEQVKKALADLEAERETYWAEKEALQKELGELKAKARLGELNSAIENFTDEEKAYAEVEINSFNEDPMAGDVDTIVSKIYAGIGAASKKAEADAKVAEQNSAKDDAGLDIFSEVNSVEDDSNEDVNIF
jgi:DNA repair exonuclease SbcCD ATPase subunit